MAGAIPGHVGTAGSVQGLILTALEGLEKSQFKRFKNHLSYNQVLEGYPTIPRGLQEEDDRVDTAARLCSHFANSALNATIITLEGINERSLAESLRPRLPQKTS